MSKKPKSIRNNFLVLKFVFKFCPFLVVFTIINIITSVVKTLLEVIIIAKAITLITEQVNINIIINGLLIYIIGIAICVGYNTIYDNYIVLKNRIVYQKNIQEYMFKKVKYIDMALYDDPTFYDRFSRTMRDSIWRGYRAFNLIKNFIINIATTIALGSFIIVNDPILIIIIIISSIISVIALTKSNLVGYNNFKNIETEDRFMWYVNRIFYRQENAAELKTTNVSNLLIEKYQENVQTINKKTIRSYKKMAKYNVIICFSSNIISGLGSYLVLLYRLAKHIIDIASFTTMINALTKFQGKVLELANLITSLKNNALYVEDFIWMLEYNPEVEQRRKNIKFQFDSITLNDVSFRYPNTDQDVLNNISMKALKGKKIAIVGVNGSGKTTLMKLLLNFYQVTKGSISLNEYNYNELDASQIRNEYSIIFQDFKIYAVTIAENILMRRVQSKEDEEIVWKALKSVGLDKKVKSLIKGIYTEVTREFDRDGANFSGGERQRLVIARVFASQKDIYILDEPTSSLDPISEERINKLIIENAKDKTMFIIAHRLSTVVDVDYIYLIDNGKIRECGTHHELMALNKRYALMFNTQKHLYEEK
ncbi:MAG: ABC transporter ATP-binding protein/permease [Acholeplasmataceae bacterium]|nr:ABC transporter ATP-binding protein/permease [Acholeplasmataceae bacterium]